jgi:hypothetical protein
MAMTQMINACKRRDEAEAKLKAACAEAVPLSVGYANRAKLVADDCGGAVAAKVDEKVQQAEAVVDRKVDAAEAAAEDRVKAELKMRANELKEQAKSWFEEQAKCDSGTVDLGAPFAEYKPDQQAKLDAEKKAACDKKAAVEVKLKAKCLEEGKALEKGKTIDLKIATIQERVTDMNKYRAWVQRTCGRIP